MLVLHWIAANCTAGIVQSGRVLGQHCARVERSQQVALPHAVDAALASAGIASTQLNMVVVVVAPGGFTALRSVVAYAHGLGLSLGIPVIGITEGEAFRHSLGNAGGRQIWCCWRDRLGRILLDRDGSVTAMTAPDLPSPQGPVVLAGEAASEVGARLAARGGDVQLSSHRVPDLVEIALAGLAQDRGWPDHHWVRPLYLEPPAARPAVREDRPAPVQ